MLEQNEVERKWLYKIYDLAENEAWLTEKAKDGFILTKFDNTYATFEKSEPQNNNYKIVILDEEKAERQIKIIEHQGFTFVANYKEYYIFYIDNKWRNKSPHLSGEMAEVVTGWFDKQIRKQIIGLLISISIIAVLLFFELYKNLFATFLVSITIWRFILYGSILGVGFFQLIREIFLLCRSKNFFLEHNKYLKIRTFITSKIGRAITLIFIFVGIFGSAGTTYLDYKTDKGFSSVSEIYESMPIVLIQDIENQNEVNGQLLETQKEIDLDEYNYVDPESTLLSPKQYKAYQTYKSNAGDKCSMRMKYHEVVGKTLARMLAKEIAIYEADENKINKLEFKGLDKVYVYQDSHEKIISVCKGKRVMFIRYNGHQPVKKIISEMSEVLGNEET
ncbi:DUF2812 domain-containing protein [Aminipila sp.]|uniref:DUF2812 domain-containing protein n=1 Tax=Aminipila sp. TaxID=2060095 RepID=UPI00289E5949|nr:DUF2812 domain-containing protein [Aminipila sp.]